MEDEISHAHLMIKKEHSPVYGGIESGFEYEDEEDGDLQSRPSSVMMEFNDE